MAQFALLGLAPGHGGAFTSLALPATASRALLLPALLALVFAYVREPSARLLASIVAASTAMALVHPSHSVLVAFGLVGFLIARAVLDVRHDLAHIGAALAAILVPAGLVVLWLLPVVRETVSHDPGQAEVRRAFARLRARARRLQPAQLPPDARALRPRWSDRGRLAGAAPAGASSRTGGCGPPSCSAAMLVTFAIALLPFVFPHFADAVSISQARRIIGFAPRAFVLVGGALVLAGFLRWALLPVALVVRDRRCSTASRATSGCPTGPNRAPRRR